MERMERKMRRTTPGWRPAMVNHEVSNLHERFC